MWVPADLGGENQSWTAHNYAAVARLKNGITLEQASHDISAIARRIYEGSSEKGEYLLGRGIVSLSKAGKDVSMRRWGPNGPAEVMPALSHGWWKGWRGPKPLTADFRDRGRGFNALSVARSFSSRPTFDPLFVGIAWLMHSCWDIAHHLWGNPLWPFMPTSSFGCMIFDAMIAIWFISGAPAIPGKPRGFPDAKSHSTSKY